MPIYKVEWLSRDKAQPYERLYQACPHGLVQQSVAWADIITASLPDTPYFGIAVGNDGEAVAGVPLYHFNGPLGSILTSVPHAGPMGGILCRKDISSEMREKAYESLLTASLQLAQDLGCATCTMITNPFEKDSNLYNRPRPPDFVFNNFCQAIYLPDFFIQKGDDVVENDFGSTLARRMFRKAEKQHLEIEWAEQNDFSPWYAIHVRRHTEIGATPLPQTLMEAIFNHTRASACGDLVIVRKGKEIIGGCLYIWGQEVADMYMPASTLEALEQGANYALTRFGCRTLVYKGIHWLNFQSSARNSGVYAFKSRFGSLELPYKFLTWTFPPFKRMLWTSFEEIAIMYKWHYVAPYDAIKQKLEKGLFEKN